MTKTETKTAATKSLQKWVEPEVRVLPVTETAGNPTVGGDGGGFADSTLS